MGYTASSLIRLAFAASLAAALRLACLAQNGFGTPYYAAAVRSMTMNVHNLFFAAFDPTGLLAIDKPPVAFWLQAGSVELFGFSGIALLLPQAIEGILSVILLFHLVRRRFGDNAGFLAALFLAITPISVAIDRTNNTDSCLVLVQLLAAWAAIVAAERGSLRMVLLSAMVLGVGFNVKMAAVLLVLPGFVALYWFTAPAPWTRRVLHLAAAAVTMSVVALSWPLTVDLTAPGSRPYVDSTFGNSVLELIAGHNALDRFVRPDWMDVVRPAFFTPRRAPAGVFRLLSAGLASQVLWLAPLALLGLRVAPGWPARLLWGGWFLVCAVVFSATAGIFLPHYLVQMAPSVAALGAIGVTCSRSPRLTAIAMAATGVWQGYLLAATDAPWWAWGAIAGTMAAAAFHGFVHARRGAVSVGIACLLIAPALWALGPVFGRGATVSPSARPVDLDALLSGSPRLAPPGDGLGNRTRLLRYLSRNRDGATFLLATNNIREASAIVIRTGEPVMVLGGYTGTMPIVSQADLARYVAEGRVRYVLLGGPSATAPGSPLEPVAGWVRENGREVDAARWRPPVPVGEDAGARRRAGYLGDLRLYEVRAEGAGGKGAGR